ncbi:cellulase family glycosylhydrolase [candidate division KSB1 bacterium]|nr:cellulase family glycosylhydrolase [candidate division KSB1 bacterium]
MKNNIMIAIIALMQSAATAAGISFSAVSELTLEPVPLDSVYIWNKTRSTDTTLIGNYTIDIDVLAHLKSIKVTAPVNFDISNNFPNSFTGETSFYIHTPQSEMISIAVYNILGEKIVETARRLDTGTHTYSFDSGSLASGIYFIHARCGNTVRVTKIVKLGSATVGQLGLRYNGRVHFTIRPNKLFSANLQDIYQFVAYARDFVSDTLDNCVPRDGDVFQFKLWPVPPPDDFTSNWRGFNLLGKFSADGSNDGYIEKDFEMIAQLGFNFVRLPVDYRTYTVRGNWYQYREEELADIDHAVNWGQKYGIHVCLNLHRAPGYCVNPPGTPLPPSEDFSLWSDPEAREAFTAHWAMFAERYKGIPTEALSFNLVNEPSNVDGPTYVESMRGAIEAIRSISPDRFIISDELNFGQEDQDDITVFDVGMSPHFYNPMGITHYKAEWVSGSDSWTEPTWPVYLMSGFLYGSYKNPLNTPLVIKGSFEAGTEFKIQVQQVSTRADFRIYADGSLIYRKLFEPGPGSGEWEEVIYREEWNCYQNIYNKTYTTVLEKPAAVIEIKITEGDWLTFNRLEIIPPPGSSGQEITIEPGITDWGVPQASYRLTEMSEMELTTAPAGYERYFTPNGFLQKWIDFKNQGIPVHVGEWGVYNKTPHDVTLAFMKDRLAAMKAAGLGWALWNFRGSFGILDSGRADVVYENYKGHKLDRKMLDLLQKY